MQSRFELPPPSPDALAHSQRVKAAILARIAARGGWIDFSEYMELCLYAPGLGYYSAGSVKLGPQGDFVTAPEISPLFAACLAHVIGPLIGGLDPPAILELGGGTGRLAGQLLVALEEQGRLPEHYFMLEPSAELRERQREELAKLAPASCHRVQWLERLPPAPMDAIILANEVADALPVSRFVVLRDEVHACGVGADDDRLIWLDRAAGTELAAAVAAVAAGMETPWPDGYSSEISLALPSWIRSLAGTLRRGAMLLFDYGLSRREYYHPDRNTGTLRCHYRHRAHDDPFFLPGLQDITAWVDFTAIADGGRRQRPGSLRLHHAGAFSARRGLGTGTATHERSGRAIETHDGSAGAHAATAGRDGRGRQSDRPHAGRGLAGRRLRSARSAAPFMTVFAYDYFWSWVFAAGNSARTCPIAWTLACRSAWPSASPLSSAWPSLASCAALTELAALNAARSRSACG